MNIRVGKLRAGQHISESRNATISARAFDLNSMPLDDLWSYHEEISLILAAKIEAEKQELEKRLAVLNRGAGLIESNESGSLESKKQRRAYPRVLPKYRNPQTSETWSGRGKQPLWLADALKAGRKLEEFRIVEASPSKFRRS
jgi:DNA-binding protein H-NS